MSTITVRNSMIGGGVTANDSRTITVDNIITAGDPIAAGIACTAGEAGALTLPSGHGLTDADVVCLTWATGYRYNCTLASTAATSTVISSGAGDTLPTSGAAVIAKQTELDIGFLGTNAVAISITADKACVVTLEGASAVDLAKSIAADGGYQWDSGNGETNPITGDTITKAHCYSKTAVAGTVAVMIGYNNA